MTIRELKEILSQCGLSDNAEIKIRADGVMKIDSLDILGCSDYEVRTRTSEKLVLILNPVSE